MAPADSPLMNPLPSSENTTTSGSTASTDPAVSVFLTAKYLSPILNYTGDGNDSSCHSGVRIMKRKTLIIFAARIFTILAFLITAGAAKALAESPEIFPQTGHAKISYITSLTISADGSFLASADNHLGASNVKIWDWTSSREYRTIILNEPGFYYHMRFSHNNKELLIMGSDNIIIFDLVSGKEIKKIDIRNENQKNNPDAVLTKYGLTRYSPALKFPVGSYPHAVKKFPNGKLAHAFNSEESSFDFYRISDGKKILQIRENKEDFVKQYVEDFSNYQQDYLGGWLNNAILTPDYRYLVIGGNWHEEKSPTIKIYDVNTGKKVRELGEIATTNTVLIGKPFNRYLMNFDFGENSHVIIWDTQSSGKPLFFLKKRKGWFGEEFGKFYEKNIVKDKDGVILLSSESPSVDGQYIAKLNKGNYTIGLHDKKSDKEIARFISFTDGEWVVITPEGYFNASPGGAKHLNVRVGMNVYSIDNFYEKFFNPVHVASVLQDKKTEGLADIRQGIKPPPEVRIVSPQPDDRFNTDSITIKVAAKDTGGGIDEIRLYHNGKALGDDQRGLKLVGTGAEKTRDFTVTLVDGLNTFRAVGFSSDRTESNGAEITVQLAAPAKDVSLYVFAVGINKYKNPALNLNYAVPDAKGIAGFFRQSQRLFKNVNIIEIYDEEATKEGILAKLDELTKTNPQDAVLIYLAGHGENVKDVWYFIPHELTYPEREEHVQTKGISSAELAAAMKNINAQKMLMLVDACKSGAALFAFRGFEDRKALSQLSRSTGTHVVAASTKDQFAAEVKELGHGVFTYTLLEGLKGKAAGGTDTVTVRKLMSYIEEQLPEITKKYKQEAQFPVVDSRGMDFPLVIVK